jgi:hypothetical protein
MSHAKNLGVILVRKTSAQILPRIYSYRTIDGGITSSTSRSCSSPRNERGRGKEERSHNEGGWKAGSVSRRRNRRRTAAAKKVLSPISESTVMDSDLVNPCRHQGEEPSAS